MAKKTLRIFQSLFDRLKVRLGWTVEQRWINVGLRTKMGIIVTVGLIGLFVTFAIIGIGTTRQATQQVLSERVMLARLSATMLDSTLFHIGNMLTTMSSQPVMQNSSASFAGQVAALQQSSIFNQDVYLFDRDGRLRASSKGTLPEEDRSIPWSHLPAVRSVLAGQKGSVSVIPGDQSLAVIAVPVLDAAHQPSGALAALLDLADPSFFPFQRPFDLGKTGTIDVVDASGRVLISTRPDQIQKSSDQNRILRELFVADKPGVETCIGCYGTESPESGDEVIAFAPLFHAPWGVVVRQKVEEVFTPIRRLKVWLLGLGTLTVLGAFGLVWVTTNSVIKPVQLLTSAAQRISEGDLSSPLEIGLSHRPWSWSPRPRSERQRPDFGRGEPGRSEPSGPWRQDEIGTLGNSFEAMRRRLKGSMEEIQAWNRELDERVRERTEAALAAQREAQAARDDLRAVIDALSDELVVIEVEGRKIQQANKIAHEQRAAQGNILGQTCYDAFHSGKDCQTPYCDCPIPAVLEAGESIRVTQVRPGQNGNEPTYVEIVASPMCDALGRVTRIVELRRDVTEEKRIKASLVRRNQELAILNTIASTVNQSLNLEDILGRALDEVLRLTTIDIGAVYLLENGIGSLKLMAYRGISEEAAHLASQLGMLDGSCGGVVETGQLVLVPDLSRYRGKRARSLQRENLTTLVHVPLTAKGCTLGSMCVGTHQRRDFGSEEQNLLTAIASQIAVAIENARLYAEVQHKEHVRGELFRKAINAQEDERKRIARELHDETSQALTALIFAAEEGLEMKKLVQVQTRLQSMRDLAQHTLDGVHKLIFDLRPTMLDHLGLVPALRWFASSRLEPKGMRVSIEEVVPRRLPPEVETALFRVVQEAITNIGRHAAARNVSIQFQYSDDEAQVCVEDDGIGFNVSELSLSPDSPRGLGLMSMQERVELLGGELEVFTRPGCGTQIRLRVPINKSLLPASPANP